MIKKFAPLMIAAAAMTSLAGCVAESGDVASNENVGDVGQAACDNPEGTNAMIAALATAVTRELHRWQVLTDFYIYRGYNNQEMLGLTQAGLNACGGSCPDTSFLLSFQDSRMDQTITFGTNKLSSWNFASRVVTGYRNQQACSSNNQCPFPAHTFGYTPTITPGTCATLYTVPVMKPAAQNHAPLTSAEITQLGNALKWTYGNGANPYIAFQGGASTVSIDPDGGMVGGDTSGTTSGASTCQPSAGVTYKGTAYAVCQASGVTGTDLTGQPCSYGSVCGTLYKAWPAFPNKYKCSATGC